ncbi:MAG: ribbon-helix-helix protein, CopG family, partial [ANME-2 cluster archaeon]|nr:ribbon-helix-helix protein, CopG family [ANME-2 cluster archaeon]
MYYNVLHGGQMTTTVSIRLPDTIINELDALTKAIDRSRTFIIRKAIETYLQEYADYQIALERLNDKDDEIISRKDMRGHLGL